jgi:hypothetical protein
MATIKTGKYLPKLLKCQAGRLGGRDLLIQLKVGGSASTLRENTLTDKYLGRECFVEANIHN